MLLSVIIPTYNGKEYILECMQSALEIKCEKEILLIDDGSDESYYTYLVQCFEECECVKIFRKANGGIVDARNYGLSKACGKYIVFMDHDDVIVPEVIVSSINTMEDTGTEMVIWSTERLLNDYSTAACDSVWIENTYKRTEICTLFIKQMLLGAPMGVVSRLGHLWQAAYKRDVIEKHEIRFKRFVNIEDDFLFMFDYLLCTNSVLTTKAVGYYWRKNLKSETYRRKNIQNALEKYVAFYQYLEDGVKTAQFQELLDERFVCHRIQEIYVSSIEVTFGIGAPFFERYCSFRKKLLVDGKIEYFTNYAMVANYTKRPKRIFYLLKHKLVFLACLYVYFDSMYRIASVIISNAAKRS